MKNLTDNFDYNDLIQLFNNTFSERYNTRLVKGGDEPIYLPEDDQVHYHRIIFARGYFSSALHEIAHWLVAGEQRRQLEDYGYWYCADGRDESSQKAFEAVEITPQAIEWALSLACGHPFRVSSDNLTGWQSCPYQFQDRVYHRLVKFLETGFNERTQCLLDNLRRFYQQPSLTQELIGYVLSENSE